MPNRQPDKLPESLVAPFGDRRVIRPVAKEDIPVICEIYNHYIEHTTVSFEESCVSDAEMTERIERVLSADYPWLVAEYDGCVLGYSYAFRWRERSAYRYAAEVAVYLAKDAVGKGTGTQLYQHLFELLRKRGVTTVIGGIGLPNPASVALHEKMGLKQVAHFNRVGYKFDTWLDVSYWQGDIHRAEQDAG